MFATVDTFTFQVPQCTVHSRHSTPPLTNPIASKCRQYVEQKVYVYKVLAKSDPSRRILERETDVGRREGGLFRGAGVARLANCEGNVAVLDHVLYLPPHYIVLAMLLRCSARMYLGRRTR